MAKTRRAYRGDTTINRTVKIRCHRCYNPVGWAKSGFSNGTDKNKPIVCKRCGYTLYPYMPYDARLREHNLRAPSVARAFAEKRCDLCLHYDGCEWCTVRRTHRFPDQKCGAFIPVA